MQGISDAVDDTEGFRKGVVWPVLTLALLSTAGFILISVGTYECVAFGHADCDAITCCVTPCAVFVAVVIWLCAASAVALSGERREGGSNGSQRARGCGHEFL